MDRNWSGAPGAGRSRIAGTTSSFPVEITTMAVGRHPEAVAKCRLDDATAILRCGSTFTAARKQRTLPLVTGRRMHVFPGRRDRE